MSSSKPLLELRPVAAPSAASAGACVYVLLPSLQELLGRPGFASRDPICVPGSARPFDAWSFFHGRRQDARSLH